MADGIVFARMSTRLRNRNGYMVEIHDNEAWAADDPLVALHPGAFQDTPPRPMRSEHPRPQQASAEEAQPPDLPRVERATHAPGEKRRR